MTRILDRAVALTFAAAVYLNLALMLKPWVWLPAPADVIRTITSATMIFSLVHGARWLGGRATLIFVLLSTGASWTLEQVGVKTGLVYGRYHYTDFLGPKLGEVPIIIPVAWFAMIYPSYVIACWLIDGRGRPPADEGGARFLWRAWVAGLVMTAWDVVLDPTYVQAGAWVWEDGGPYFGVPRQNFFGWMLTTATIYSLFGRWFRRKPPPAANEASWLGALPALVYGVMTLRYSVDPGRGALSVVAFFVMGLPFLVALGRFWDARRSA
jgi:putative membrane protein